MSKTWLDKKELSRWALTHCRHIKDKLIIRQFIVDSWCSLIYCTSVEDRPEIRRNIIDFDHIFIYKNNKIRQNEYRGTNE